jgi:hypothetical protein
MLRPRSPRERRVCQRVAAGLTPAQAARAEGVADAEVEALVARPAFAAVVDAYRYLEEMDEAARLARLERIAWLALENALADGDVRAAMFVLRERAQGRNPALILAKRVAAGLRPAPSSPAGRAAEASAEAGPRPRRYDDPCPSALAKGAARATEQAAAEEAARQVALTETAADEDAEEITPALPARRGSATVSPRPAGGDGVVPSAKAEPGRGRGRPRHRGGGLARRSLSVRCPPQPTSPTRTHRRSRPDSRIASTTRWISYASRKSGA